MYETRNNSRSPSSRTALVWVAVVALGVLFVANQQVWNISTFENYQLTAEDAEALVRTGSLIRRLSYVGIGIMGVALAQVPGTQDRRSTGMLGKVLALYLLVCFISILWSLDPGLTCKRLGILAFCLLGVWGFSKHLSTRALVVLALCVSLTFVVGGFLVELVLGTFDPTSPTYRFAGMAHPNSQATYCAVLCLSAFFAGRNATRGKWFFFGLLLLGAASLLLTKSRSNVVALIFAAAAAWLFVAPRSKQVLAALGTPLVVCAVVLAALMIGVELFDELDGAVRFGRESSDPASLNGRIPLWLNLLSDIAERPWLGHGYDCFWTPARIFDVSVDFEWTVPNAHSAPVEVLLNVGVIGGALGAAVLVLGLRRCVATYQQSRDASDGFVLALLMFAVVQAALESSFYQPVDFVSFVAACGFVNLAFCPGAQRVWRKESVASATRPQFVS